MKPLAAVPLHLPIKPIRKTLVTNTSIAFSGIWPALLTPLNADLSIDIPAFARHANALLTAGCSGVTPFGTTGEGPSFSVTERMATLDGLIAAGVPAQRILVSTSCAALPDVLALTQHAVNVGAFGCLLLPPFFLKGVPDQGVIDFYSQVIDQVADPKLRLVLYHIPQVSGVALSHTAVHALVSRYPGTIVGIKDSGCQRDISLAFAKAFMPPLQVWVGNEPDLQLMASHGSVGAVSGVGNVMPYLLQRLVHDFDTPQAHRDMQRTHEFLAILAGYGMTAAFKGVMAILSGDAGWRAVRAPLVALSDAEYSRLEVQMNAFMLDRNRD